MKSKIRTAICLILMIGLSYPAAGYGAEGYDAVAPSSAVSSSDSVVKYGMTPVYGRDIADGSYDVTVDSSSSFFRITRARLSVKGGKLSAAMTLSSVSYEYIYLGTPEEAAAAPLEEYIAPKDHAGESTFTFRVSALNREIDCAAFSKKKQQWYPRKILFDASSLPDAALKIPLPDYDKIEKALDAYDADGDAGKKTVPQPQAAQKSAAVGHDPVDIDRKDGEYSIQVQMTGGSGRASVTSPTWFLVKDGKAYARLMWSSPYYDYMILGGKTYLNETEDGGNATFTIPIPRMDEPFPVIADTTAMGDPVEIEYELTFYRDTVGSERQIPQEAATDVLIVSLIIIVIGGILNIAIKRRRKQ